MSVIPHIVLLDTDANWPGEELANLQSGMVQSFCRENAVVGADTHGLSMLKVLSVNLKGSARVSLGKVITHDSEGSPQAFARGLVWAAELYPDVVVIPLGMMKPNSSVKAALEILANTHCRIYAALGNNAQSRQDSLYPAAYPECISVGSAQQGQLYREWSVKPDMLIDESIVTSMKSLKNIQMGTSTATMLAVAEYINHEFFDNKVQFNTY
jgi:hypothetical protein